MKGKHSHGQKALTEAEKEIMDVIWGKNETTVRGVLETLQKHKEVAYTTVMTLMDILHKKGHLTRKLVGKAYVYSPAQDKKTFQSMYVGRVVEELFDQYGEIAVNQFAAEIDSLPDKLKQRLKEKLSNE